LIENELFTFVYPPSSAATSLGSLVMFGLLHNTCVLATYPAKYTCPVKTMHKEWIKFDHAAIVEPGDLLVCMGRERVQFSQAKFENFVAMAERLPEAAVSNNANGFAGGRPQYELSSTDLNAEHLMGRAPTSHRFFNQSSRHESLESMLEDSINSHYLVKEEPTRAVSRLDDARKTRHVLGTLDILIPSHSIRELDKHIIVSADHVAHASLLVFIRHLRRSNSREAVRPILILRPQPPRSVEWAEISKFPEVYWQLGRCAFRFSLCCSRGKQ